MSVGSDIAFAELPEALAEAMRARGRVIEYARGDVIHRQGGPSDAAFYVVEGRARVSSVSTTGRELVLRDLEGGELFGDLGLLDGMPRSHDVTALEPMRVVTLSGADFSQTLADHPDLYQYFVRLQCLRLRMCFEFVNGAVFLSAPARLAARLLHMYEPGDLSTGQSGGPITASQSDIALMTACSRQTVNRELKSWERAGTIQQTDAGLVIVDPEQLRKLVNEPTPE